MVCAIRWSHGSTDQRLRRSLDPFVQPRLDEKDATTPPGRSSGPTGPLWRNPGWRSAPSNWLRIGSDFIGKAWKNISRVSAGSMGTRRGSRASHREPMRDSAHAGLDTFLIPASRIFAPAHRHPFRRKARSPRVSAALLHCTTAGSTPPRLDHESFAAFCPLALPGNAFYPVLVHRLAAALHASSPHSVTLMQLRFASLAVINSWRDLHPQVCARAGRTPKKPHRLAGLFPNRGRANSAVVHVDVELQPLARRRAAPSRPSAEPNSHTAPGTGTTCRSPSTTAQAL